jgi:NDP-sugar pyrophosphorylase family protein
MAEVAGRPFLEWLLRALQAQGVRRVILCTGHKGEMVEKYFGDGKLWNLEIQYSQEPVPLGTAGAVRNALDLIEKKQFLVLNGDSYCRLDLKQLVNSHIKKKALITMWLVNVDDCQRYGLVQIGEDGAVQAFQEKSSVQSSGLINAGIYLMERNIGGAIPERHAYSLETDFFPQFVGRGLYAVVGKPPFIDIGTPESFAGAGKIILQEEF